MVRSTKKSISLALQGGGSHGAFTWGVLDRLLAQDEIVIAAVSGTSAGAMNAVVVADGLVAGGRPAARAALESFWQAVSDAGRLSPVQRNPIERFFGDWSLDRSPGYHFFNALTRVVSPYQTNPLDFNPLRYILEEAVDFERVRACDQMELYVSATNVETGAVKVFDRCELTADMVMASACLPLLFRAVEVDGVPYWDGGYSGNPTLAPLRASAASHDIVIVQINPIERAGTPTTAQEILNRMNEITFNSSLLQELAHIEFVSDLVEKGRLEDGEQRKMCVHIIENESALKPLGVTSKMNSEWAFLTHLRDIGQATADAWIEEHADEIGHHSSVKIEDMLMRAGLQCSLT